MKKLLSILFMVIFAIQLAPAREIVTKDEMQLPLAARNFIKQHFTNPQISYIKIESEFLRGKKYEVVLTNGTEIDFDSKGQWTEVNTKRNPMPATIVPDYIRDYVSVHFRDNIINQIERDRRGTEVELNNGINLKFDRNGNFIKMDD